jgi:hypothetical protein
MKELTRRWKAEQKRVLALLSEAVRLQFICRLGYGDPTETISVISRTVASA